MADKIEILLEGHQANGWPLVCVEFNGLVLWDQSVEGQQFLEFENVEFRDSNLLIFKHYGKTDESSLPGHDRWCDLHWFSINGCKVDINFLSEHNILYQADDGERLITSYLGKNGQLIFEFPWPLWRFWRQCQHLQD